MGYNTKIGMEGNGISQGQRQRLLIARVVYKSLNEFFSGKTVVIVAHRLSTVRNADNIVVVDGGQIAEQGSHEQLIALKGKYYNLVKNQLEQ